MGLEAVISRGIRSGFCSADQSLSQLVEVPDIGPHAPVPIVPRDIAPIIIHKVHDVNRQPNDMFCSVGHNAI